MAETLSMLSIISFIVAGVALAVAIFLWIFFKIPRVIGDLSGRNARKSIARVELVMKNREISPTDRVRQMRQEEN